MTIRQEPIMNEIQRYRKPANGASRRPPKKSALTPQRIAVWNAFITDAMKSKSEERS